MELYKHNQEAYEKVMEHLQNHRKVCFIQPTGTGKSFVGGAVAENYKKVLIVAPNTYVINQASAAAPHADCVTYNLISKRDEMPDGYDLIWFDEFHRIGAETWGKGAQKLIDANPQAKVLGSSATPVRYLQQRNMADEFFHGNVASEYDLVTAWTRKILRVPIYVVGAISAEDTRKDYTQRIQRAKRLNDQQKAKANAMLDNVIRDWSMANGVDRILAKYIDKDVKRMIVFAQTIHKLKEVQRSLPKWFRLAELTLANVYTVHSGMGDEAEAQMEAFEKDDSDGIKVLLSVDMLNEGIHVDRVDAVMLLRSTISRNLYLQQIGRCFAVGQKHQPIILDFADNLTSAFNFDGIYEARDRYLHDAGSYTDDMANERPQWSDEFKIIDTLKNTRELIEQLDETLVFHDGRTQEEKLADYVAFCEQHHRLPSHSHKPTVDMTDDERNEQVLCCFAMRNTEHPVIIEMRDKYKTIAHMDNDEKVDTVIEYIRKHKRIPCQYRGDFSTMTDERAYENKIALLMKKHMDNETIRELFMRYREMRHIPKDEKIQMCREFIQKNHRLPVCVKSTVRISDLTDEEIYERRLACYMTSHRDDEEIRQLRNEFEQFQDITIEEKRTAILRWCEENGTYPVAKRGDTKARQYTQWVAAHPNDELIPILRERYGYKPYRDLQKEKRQKLIDFITTNKRLPRYKIISKGVNLDVSDEESMLANSMKQIVKRHPEDTELIELYNQYVQKPIDYEELIAEIYTFCKEHGHRPSRSTSNKREAYLASVFTTKEKYKKIKDDPRIKEVITLPFRTRECKHMPNTDVRAFRKQALIRFINEHGYLPRFGTQFGEEGTTASYWARFKETDEEVMQLYRTTPMKAQYDAQQLRQSLIDMLTKEYRRPDIKTERTLYDILTKQRNAPDIKAAVALYEAHEYTLERLIERASRFSTQGEFYQGDKDAYNASKRLGIFNQVIAQYKDNLHESTNNN